MKKIILAALLALSCSAQATEFYPEANPNDINESVDSELAKSLLKRDTLELKIKIVELEVELAKMKKTQVLYSIALESMEKNK